MLFQSSIKWWGDGGRRNAPHEGVDFHSFKTLQEEDCSLNETTRVPLIFGGEIVRILDDFLGQSVFIRHNYPDKDRKRLYSVYGHIIPVNKIQTGVTVKEEDSIGTVAGGKRVPSHLHISVAWISASVIQQDLNWETILDKEKAMLINPLTVIVCPYSILN